MSRSVLVTGGAGYIGSHACKALARAGYLPVTVDNLVYGHPWAVKWGPLIEADIGDGDRIRRIVAEYKIEAAIHFAAFAYVGESVRDPRKYFRNNVTSGLALIEALTDAGCRNIVFSSTCATYGIPNAVPIGEDHAQLPINPYGETKLFIERALRWWGEAYGMRWAVLRYFNAAGADPDGEVGEQHDPETHLIPLAIEAARNQGKPLEIFGDDYDTPDGTAIRDYIHVMDLAEAHVLALRHLLSGGPNLALNLGTGNGNSVLQVVGAVEKVVGHRVAARFAPRRPGDPPALIADPRRAKNALNWQPDMSDIDTIVRTAWKWHTKAVR